MNSGTRKRRPRQDAVSLKLAHPSLTPADDVLDDIAAHVNGVFVIVVETAGRHRRRCFLTAAAAEKAARRAVQAGHPAEVFLAELRPLWRLELDEAPVVAQ